ncbi:MAG: hypothetical protein NTV86_23520 [Planctomycetota bacterium]|nr:hypothetical protein [Planctomycetota bacterium]
MLFYRPAPGLFVSDLWCTQHEGLWYVYGCQGDANIGLATSPDLTDYTYQGVAIPGDWFGGDVFRWKGKHYMVYSHMGTEGNFINLASSDDLRQWKDLPGNPILSFPDPRWYDGAVYKKSLRAVSNCRDPHFIKDASTGEWAYLCFAADTGRGDPYRRACIGLARSRDLKTWQYLPPLFAPARSMLMEVPRVCRIGGKWFLTWLDAPWYGQRPGEEGPRPPSGPADVMIQYALADHPLGPYRLADDPTLLQGQFSPYVIDFARVGRRVMVVCNMFCQHGDRPDAATRGGLLPAMPIRQARGNPGKLEIHFPRTIRPLFHRRPRLVAGLRVNNPEHPHPDVKRRGRTITFTRTSTRLVELTGATGCDLIVDVDLRLTAGRAGIVTRYADRRGCAVLIDPARAQLQFVEVHPAFRSAVILKTLERHAVTGPLRRAFRLAVIQSHDTMLVFVNDVLAATFSFARREKGKVALLLENASGACRVRGVSARKSETN